MAVPRVEPEIAEDPQMVLGNSLERVADESDRAGLQVVEPAEIIEKLAAEGIGI